LPINSTPFLILNCLLTIPLKTKIFKILLAKQYIVYMSPSMPKIILKITALKKKAKRKNQLNRLQSPCSMILEEKGKN